MGPKRKQQNKRAPAETTTAKKKRPNTETAPIETNEIQGNPAFDIEALTAKITKQVTDSVVTSLQDSGLLPRRPGTSDAEKDSTKNGDQSSEINAQKHSHVKSSLTNGADNSVTDLTSSTSSSDKVDKMLKSNQHFVSSRVPLHATVSLKKKEKKMVRGIHRSVDLARR